MARRPEESSEVQEIVRNRAKAEARAKELASLFGLTTVTQITSCKPPEKGQPAYVSHTRYFIKVGSRPVPSTNVGRDILRLLG